MGEQEGNGNRGRSLNFLNGKRKRKRIEAQGKGGNMRRKSILSTFETAQCKYTMIDALKCLNDVTP